MTISLSLWKLVLLFLEVAGSSLGLPGGMATLIALGSLSSDIPDLLVIIAIGFIAAIIGDLIAYTVGRSLSKPLLERLRTFNFFLKNEEKARKLLYRRGFLTIFLTRFAITGLCAATSYVAGLEKYNRKKFITAVVFGEFLYAFIYPLIGYAVGSVLNNLLSTINYVVLAILVLIILFYLGKYFIKKYCR